MTELEEVIIRRESEQIPDYTIYNIRGYYSDDSQRILLLTKLIVEYTNGTFKLSALVPAAAARYFAQRPGFLLAVSQNYNSIAGIEITLEDFFRCKIEAVEARVGHLNLLKND